MLVSPAAEAEIVRQSVSNVVKRPRNPVRRSRNIGTAKQGHGADNELVIPWPFADDRYFTERLRDPREHVFEVHGVERVALVEPPAPGYVYGCTVSDLGRLLPLVPEDDLDELDLFLFRHPTRKQRILEPVWGRFLYYACPGKHRGSAICFESQDLQPLRWSKSMEPERARELERLRDDGHRIVSSRRSLDIHVTPESIRNTVLFRTTLHEIGHYVDWLRSELRVHGETEAEDAAIRRAFESKTSSMKEDFAHRYAAAAAAELRKSGQIPFDTEWDEESMKSSGIERDWFA